MRYSFNFSSLARRLVSIQTTFAFNEVGSKQSVHQRGLAKTRLSYSKTKTKVSIPCMNT